MSYPEVCISSCSGNSDASVCHWDTQTGNQRLRVKRLLSFEVVGPRARLSAEQRCPTGFVPIMIQPPVVVSNKVALFYPDEKRGAMKR